MGAVKSARKRLRSLGQSYDWAAIWFSYVECEKINKEFKRSFHRYLDYPYCKHAWNPFDFGST